MEYKIALEKTLDVLLALVSTRFVQEEGANLLFLVRSGYHHPKFQQVVAIVKKECNMDITLWIAINGFYSPNKKFISHYKNEFPSLVFENNLMIATRVFVAEGLASWTHFQNEAKFDTIIQIGLQRLNLIQNTELYFKRNGKLRLSSEYLIYFVTHIILLATFYGERIYIFNFSVVDLVTRWMKIVPPNQNLEIWLELSICMCLLNQPIDILETISLFNPKLNIKNNHQLYHTFALWTMLFETIRQ